MFWGAPFLFYAFERRLDRESEWDYNGIFQRPGVFMKPFAGTLLGRPSITLFLCLVGLSSNSLARDVLYSVTDLGNLGGDYAYVSGINNRGEVVGNGTTNGVNFMHAFIYRTHNLSDLGTLGGTNSYGYAINDNGQVVGSAYTAGGQDDAFLDSEGLMTDLGTLGGTGSDARAINNSGQIAGGAWTTGNTEYHAYLLSGGIKTDLGTLGGTRSDAFAINDSGQVAGRASVSGISSYHAFLYSAGAISDLGTLGGSLSWAYGINNAGQVVGGARTGAGIEHAFLFDNYTMVDLESGALWESRAYAINNLGQIVGFTTSGGAQHAVLYSAGTMTDLNSVIDTNLSWTLEIATGINDGGQIIGVGTHPAGKLGVFLLTPFPVLQISLAPPNSVQLQFTAQANRGYAIEYRDSLSNGTWQAMAILDPISVIHPVSFNDALVAGRPARYYRVRVL